MYSLLFQILMVYEAPFNVKTSPKNRKVGKILNWNWDLFTFSYYLSLYIKQDSHHFIMITQLGPIRGESCFKYDSSKVMTYTVKTYKNKRFIMMLKLQLICMHRELCQWFQVKPLPSAGRCVMRMMINMRRVTGSPCHTPRYGSNLMI